MLQAGLVGGVLKRLRKVSCLFKRGEYKRGKSDDISSPMSLSLLLL